MIKELYDEAQELEQMDADFAMMREDGTYEILFPEPSEEDIERMYQELYGDEEDFFVPEAEDYAKREKEMGEIPL